MADIDTAAWRTHYVKGDRALDGYNLSALLDEVDALRAAVRRVRELCDHPYGSYVSGQICDDREVVLVEDVLAALVEPPPAGTCGCGLWVCPECRPEFARSAGGSTPDPADIVVPRPKKNVRTYLAAGGSSTPATPPAPSVFIGGKPVSPHERVELVPAEVVPFCGHADCEIHGSAPGLDRLLRGDHPVHNQPAPPAVTCTCSVDAMTGVDDYGCAAHGPQRADQGDDN